MDLTHDPFRLIRHVHHADQQSAVVGSSFLRKSDPYN